MRATITPRKLLATILVLLTLTFASLGLSFLHPPALWALVLALGIAAAKITLVALFFMELAEHGGGVRLVALSAPLFVAIMVLLMLTDVWMR